MPWRPEPLAILLAFPGRSITDLDWRMVVLIFPVPELAETVPTPGPERAVPPDHYGVSISCGQ
jgi:hypothetical protein